MPVTDMFWGDRYGQIEDPFGHCWSIATHVRNVTPADMQKAMQSCAANRSLHSLPDEINLARLPTGMTLRTNKGLFQETEERAGKNNRSCVMIRTAIISVLASFILFTAWAVNVVSYHPAAGLDPLTAAQHEL